MNYPDIEAQIMSNLAELGTLTHIGPTTLPADDIATFNAEGMPAAILRLLGVSWNPAVGDSTHYRGTGKVELTLLADPTRTPYGDFYNLVQAARNAALKADESGFLSSEASYPGPRYEYRIILMFKMDVTVE